ncbi:MAG: helix-turn-helix domain-containing protein [Muribaculaceae bacterium]|nr:helix-turn-helix domain-containing protein [Muribaculaceae bacterium]
MTAEDKNNEIRRTFDISDISRYFNRKAGISNPEKYAVYYEVENALDRTGAPPIRVLGVTIALCLEGDGEVGIGVKKYKFCKNSLMLLNPNQYVQSISSKDRVRIMAIGCNLEMMEAIMPKISGLLPLLIHNPIESVTQLSEEDSLDIQEYMRLISAKLQAKDSPLKRTKIACIIQALLCEIIEIHSVSGDGVEKPRSRKEEILSRFILEVLQNFRCERSVAFYADKLCVTPKHLSAVAKDITGHTASELIDHYVIMEAKIMLAETALTIQEISNKLNFANQSFFGKYFKHLTGYSPSEFRKMASIQM